MTERQYPIHLRRIGEPEIADYLESMVIEMDTHEKMFLELCELRRERDAIIEVMRRGGLVCAVCCGRCAHSTVRRTTRHDGVEVAEMWCRLWDHAVGPECFCSEGVPREVTVDGID